MRAEIHHRAAAAGDGVGEVFRQPAAGDTVVAVTDADIIGFAEQTFFDQFFGVENPARGTEGEGDDELDARFVHDIAHFFGFGFGGREYFFREDVLAGAGSLQVDIFVHAGRCGATDRVNVIAGEQLVVIRLKVAAEFFGPFDSSFGNFVPKNGDAAVGVVGKISAISRGVRVPTAEKRDVQHSKLSFFLCSADKPQKITFGSSCNRRRRSCACLFRCRCRKKSNRFLRAARRPPTRRSAWKTRVCRRRGS